LLYHCRLELDPAKLKADLKLSSFISFFGVMVPFGASCLLTLAFMHEEYSDTSFINLALFLTCALGMSALPVLARILSERRMLTTRIGVCACGFINVYQCHPIVLWCRMYLQGLAMTVAAVDDIVAYALLALTVALIRSSSQLGVLWTILLTIGELLTMFFVVGPVIRWLVRKDDGHSHLNADTFLFLSLILIGSAYVTEVIGLSALIGAFQVGLLIPRRSNLVCILDVLWCVNMRS
jgi:Kef-type K+ transport system membrane component KefB